MCPCRKVVRTLSSKIELCKANFAVFKLQTPGIAELVPTFSTDPNTLSGTDLDTATPDTASGANNK